MQISMKNIYADSQLNILYTHEGHAALSCTMYRNYRNINFLLTESAVIMGKYETKVLTF